ncbi:MAG: carbon storage regulator CsrA [Actinobacteria bacterium]|nr:carbon storage regulator CsrA [Actinomycetota bacterium]
MLVLSRRKGEAVIIGNDITVRIIDVRGDQVRVGIDAPRSVSVHREEVFRQVVEENVAAARSADLTSPLLQARRPDSSPGAAKPIPPPPG